MIARPRLTIILEPEMIKILKLIAIEREISVSQICSAAISDYLGKHTHLISASVIAENERKRLKEKGFTSEQIREKENNPDPL